MSCSEASSAEEEDELFAKFTHLVDHDLEKKKQSEQDKYLIKDANGIQVRVGEREIMILSPIPLLTYPIFYSYTGV